MPCRAARSARCSSASCAIAMRPRSLLTSAAAHAQHRLRPTGRGADMPMKRKIAVAVLAALIAGTAAAQQAPRGNHSWAPSAPGGKHHVLPATLDTVQWGWLDPREKPKLTVNSGDTVSIETMMHAHDKVQPG